jgi:hypothetical protein
MASKMMVLVGGEASLAACYDKVGIIGGESLMSQIWRRVFVCVGMARKEDLFPL